MSFSVSSFALTCAPPGTEHFASLGALYLYSKVAVDVPADLLT